MDFSMENRHVDPYERQLANMRNWRRNHPDKVALSDIRRAQRACEAFPELGYSVIQTAPEQAKEMHLAAALQIVLANGYSVMQPEGGC